MYYSKFTKKISFIDRKNCEIFYLHVDLEVLFFQKKCWLIFCETCVFLRLFPRIEFHSEITVNVYNVCVDRVPAMRVDWEAFLKYVRCIHRQVACPESGLGRLTNVYAASNT